MLYHDSSIGVTLFGDNNKNNDESILFFDKSNFLFLECWCWVFFLEKTGMDIPFSIAEQFDFDTSGKTTSWITSTCSTFCWEEYSYPS